ncbi:MAG: hypothetical protein GY814_03240 [Gammaproteobacteria bacterium]|nr:hypothetical protein [Gammaproteobacteria bacterium]
MNIQQIFGEYIFSLMIAIFIFLPIVFAAILVMHFLMPREVLKRYFKPPYFREFECLFFSGVPYAPIRTVMFMRTIANPQSGLKRGITRADRLVPTWYRICSKIVIIAIYVGAAASLFFLIGGGVVFFSD